MIEKWQEFKNYGGEEAECLDNTPPVDTEGGVSDRKYDSPDETPPVHMEEGVSDRKYDRN